jgi:hypothetical protein
MDKFAVCECGHMSFVHERGLDCTEQVPDGLPWRDEQGNLVQVRRRCECETFRRDR